MVTSRIGLEHLFGSDTRLKLLRVFLHHPDQSFYVRELTRRVGTQIHAIRRELMNLERLGIVRAADSPPGDPTESLKKGPRSQRKYYTIQSEHLLYPELKSLLLKADLLAREDLARRLRTAGNIMLLILTGRFVGNRAAPTDMLVVGALNRKVLKDVVRDCEREFGHEVNYTLFSPREFKYRKEVTDRFLYEILEGKNIVLVNTGSETHV